MPKEERELQRIERLEVEIVKILEATGLVKEVKIGGDLTSKESPLYLEYKLKQEDSGNNSEAVIRAIRTCIASRLTKNNSEISAVRRNYNGHSGSRREYIELCSRASIGDGLTLKYSILQCIKKEVENYLMRR